MRRNKRYYITRALIAVFALAFIFSGAMMIRTLVKQSQAKQHNAWTAPTGSETETLAAKEEYQGKKYRLNSSLSTVLFLGIDYGSEEDNKGNVVGTEGRSDTIILFILDDDNKTIKALLIPRDTMVNVDYYDEKGYYFTSAYTQITRQYSFGDSRKRSNYLTRKKVSEALLGIRVDDCLSFDAAGIVPVVEALGGVTITFTEDHTDIDPAYKKGASVKLSGKEMEHFIRERDVEETGSNIPRVLRSYDLVQSVFTQLKNGTANYTLDELSDIASEYIESDLDAETLKKLSSYTFIDETILLPGETTRPGKYDEYHLNVEEEKELLLELFYKER
jgi:LCP family protein required for cell wall assembly